MHRAQDDERVTTRIRQRHSAPHGVRIHDPGSKDLGQMIAESCRLRETTGLQCVARSGVARRIDVHEDGQVALDDEGVAVHGSVDISDAGEDSEAQVGRAGVIHSAGSW